MAAARLKSALLSAVGNDAFVVGGAVRDRLLGRDTLDIDLVVPDRPEDRAAKLAALTGGHAFPLHAELGIHRVTMGDRHIDIARIQGASLEEDLARRDLTINALAVPLTAWFGGAWRNRIVDRHRGLADLKKKRLVSVSPKAFREDPLRLLRTFRIAAETGFALAPETKKRIAADRRLAARPAGERQRDEFMKLFATPRAHAALAGMDACGVLDVVFPAAKDLRRTAPAYYGRGGVLKHTLDSVLRFEEILETLASWFPRHHRKIRTYLDAPVSGYPRLAHLKWALVLHDIGKPKTAKMREGRLRFFEHEHVGADMVGALAERYRWSTDETERYARLVRNHMRPGNLATHEDVTDRAIYRFFRDLGDDGLAMLLVSLADHLTYLTAAQRRRRDSAHELVTLHMVQRLYRHPGRVMPKRILTGHDVMRAFNLKPSPLIGKLLAEAHEAQADGKIKSAQDALDFLRPVVSALTPEEREGKK